MDTSGNAYVTGLTQSSNFPTKNSLQPYRGGAPGSSYGSKFVTKFFSSGGALLYSTFLGGSRESMTGGGPCIAVDRSGNAYVAGGTSSTDFPTKNALEPSLNGPSDGFVTKIATPVSGAAGGPVAFGGLIEGQGSFPRGRMTGTGNLTGPAIELIAGSLFFRS